MNWVTYPTFITRKRLTLYSKPYLSFLSSDILNFLRPFLRREDNTARPFAVSMRLRKPWTVLRLRRWGWNVRFIYQFLLRPLLCGKLTDSQCNRSGRSGPGFLIFLRITTSPGLWKDGKGKWKHAFGQTCRTGFWLFSYSSTWQLCRFSAGPYIGIV